MNVLTAKDHKAINNTFIYMTYCNPTTDVDFQKLITQFEFWIQHAPDYILRQPIADLEFKSSPEKWSKKEICGHLVDSAINNLQRFTGAIHAKESYNIYPYPQDALVQIKGYQNQPADEIVQLWQHLNSQIFKVVSPLNAEQLAQPIVMAKTGETFNLEWLISDYICHLEHHLKQLFPFEKNHFTQQYNWILGLVESEVKLGNVKEKFITLVQEGDMSVELYAPEEKDLQSPHLQDELYIVESGHGIFYRDGDRIPIKAGDIIFVPARMEHRFEDFSDNFKTWVVFY